MKLKKIASLALAGIMAVSMLAGCNGSSSSSTTTDPETTTGIVAAVNNGQDKTNEVKVNVTFSSALTNALKGYLATKGDSVINTGINAGSGKAVDKTALGAHVDDLEDAAGLDGYVATFTFNAKDKMLGTWKIGQLYAANGSDDIEKVMKNIAGLIKDDAECSTGR